MAGVLVPLGTMRVCKPRLLPKDYAQVESDSDDDGVVVQAREAERHRSTQKYELEGDVHGLARIAIQANENPSAVGVMLGE